MNLQKSRSPRGVSAALLATLFAGLAPIFGKLAYQADVDASTLVALRTALAAAILWLFYLIVWRRYISIGWNNLISCVGMGVANGLGSLLYYNGLSRVDASLAHLLYSMYPFWVFIFLSAAGHPISRLSILRLGLALASVVLLTWQGGEGGIVDPLGVTLMIGAGALYGFHLVLGQWTLVDVDPRTVALYGLTTMAIVVGIPFLVQGGVIAGIAPAGWTAILLHALLPTALARLLVFAGLWRLGGIQSSLLGVAEVLVALVMAFAFLGERFALAQWFGAVLFAVSILLIARDTSFQIASEDTFWLRLFPEPSPEDRGDQPGVDAQSEA